MRRLLALLLCLLMLSAQALAAQPADEEVDRLLRGARTVGGSVVVYLRGELVYARDYGFRHLARREPVDERTYFRTASLTKLITGVGVMRLVEAGKLDLDRDISDYLGFRAGNSRAPGVAITMRQLMSHTSSLRDEGGFSNPRHQLSDLLRLDLKRTANFEPWAPGSAYRYSNFGAGVVGAIIEAVSGQSVHSYMKQAVFGPLDIDAAYAAGLLGSPQDVSSQYRGGKMAKTASRSLKDPYEDKADPQNHFRDTIGSVWMRSRDMAKLLALLAGDGQLGDTRLLTPDSVAQMQADQQALGRSVTGPSPYGLFLERNDTLVKGKTFYGHQGMSSGAILNAYFEPDSQFVLVLFSNGGSMARVNRVGKLARSLLSYLYPIFVGR